MPEAIAIEPPSLGNPSFTVGVKDGTAGDSAVLWIDTALSQEVSTSGVTVFLALSPELITIPAPALMPTGTGNTGHTSLSLDLPADPTLFGMSRFGQWQMIGPSMNVSASNAFKYVFF